MEVAPRYLHCYIALFTCCLRGFTLIKQKHVCLYILLGKVRTLLHFWAKSGVMDGLDTRAVESDFKKSNKSQMPKSF